MILGIYITITGYLHNDLDGERFFFQIFSKSEFRTATLELYIPGVTFSTLRLVVLLALGAVGGQITRWCIEKDVLSQEKADRRHRAKLDAANVMEMGIDSIGSRLCSGSACVRRIGCLRDCCRAKCGPSWQEQCCPCCNQKKTDDDRAEFIEALDAEQRETKGGLNMLSQELTPHCSITVQPTRSCGGKKMVHKEQALFELNLKFLLSLNIFLDRGKFKDWSVNRVIDVIDAVFDIKQGHLVRVTRQAYYSGSGKMALDLFFAPEALKHARGEDDKAGYIQRMLTTPLPADFVKKAATIMEHEAWSDLKNGHQVVEKESESDQRVIWSTDLQVADISMDAIAGWYPAFFINKMFHTLLTRMAIAVQGSFEEQIVSTPHPQRAAWLCLEFCRVRPRSHIAAAGLLGDRHADGCGPTAVLHTGEPLPRPITAP